MAIAANLGFPRIGYRRELKKVLEQYWQGKATEEGLLAVARNIRQQNWQLQKAAGIEHIPSNDFSLYDHVLDTATIFGAIPERYKNNNGKGQGFELGTYFRMARGQAPNSGGQIAGDGIVALEMTKWFDTNYHYIVPELKAGQEFQLLSHKPVDEFQEAKELGIHTRPVLLGPVSFLLLSKMNSDASPLILLERLMPVYCQLLAQLKSAGADWVQIDEPCLVFDLQPGTERYFKQAYEKIAQYGLKVLLASYFSRLGNNLELAMRLPVQAIHLDLVSAPEQLEPALKLLPPHMMLSAGVISGRNIWACNPDPVLSMLDTIRNKIGEERLMIAPSCSLLHVPVDAEQETKIDPHMHQWLAFAKQKVEEISMLAGVLRRGENSASDKLEEKRKAAADRKASLKVHNKTVQEHLSRITDAMLIRTSNYAKRSQWQHERLHLPMLPTTTIGSFPQTKEVRQARADYKASKINLEEYTTAMKAEIAKTIAAQEEIGLDVFVHGEAERNDMVEYFAENLEGYIVTEHGWVQSFGSRYVKPPIIYGDIVRHKPITVDWLRYAQSLTEKPVKGMLTGPITMLFWSFVRDDQPRSQTCLQLATVIRDEVVDIENAGIKAIQVDEPAIREGLPLHKEEWQEYLNWAIKCFRLASSGVQDYTQIHTHMCYSDFNDIIEAVAALDADVVSIEMARSQQELLDAFAKFEYTGEIGPGVYDIHSPRVPAESEMISLIQNALTAIPARQLWVNPDCGLKTRRWEEVMPALKAMVNAASSVRKQLVKRAEIPN